MAPAVQPVNSGIRFFEPGSSGRVQYTFAIIASRFRDKWLWVRHKDRETWELPAGHLEPGESPLEAARRELYEETGALEYHLKPVVSYEGNFLGRVVYGMIFLAEIQKSGPLPDFEIRETALFDGIPESLTYPEIQPEFFRYILETIDNQ